MVSTRRVLDLDCTSGEAPRHQGVNTNGSLSQQQQRGPPLGRQDSLAIGEDEATPSYCRGIIVAGEGSIIPK